MNTFANGRGERGDVPGWTVLVFGLGSGPERLGFESLILPSETTAPSIQCIGGFV